MFYPSALTYAATASAAESAARQARTEVDLAKHDIERLLMVTEALWTLLKREHGYTDDVLVKLVTEIDLRDGRFDGRTLDSPPAPCPSCGKTNTARRPNCIFCGKPLPSQPFAR